MRIGIGYLGSERLETSTANQEVIPERKRLYKFSFLNRADTQVMINGKELIFLQANQGFNMDEEDQPLQSFVVVDEGIEFNWIGAYL
ncbi:hypothetical protein [Halalkalibacter krulwichiae]|uniref:Uncharacterized protein n=1 Tax=Halalkalibacter krulwichiae TaxID=199441 RepID=A0A1X9MBJ0_9BACI|nr:hypothetical protein [Halalkalibacter krulwichiae]ARK30787.1 hypothetical protein BkAM31D_13600 [Halalkalibacter krulwichiae]